MTIIIERTADRLEPRQAAQTAPRYHGLATMQARTREAILAAADKHELIFLERLQALIEDHGPDGIIVRNDFDASLLAVLIDVLREAREVQP